LCKHFCREENTQLKQSLEEKTSALDLIIQEHQAVKAELEQALTKQKVAEDENRNLIDRWMLEKMKDAERLNEVPYFLVTKTAAFYFMVLQIRIIFSLLRAW
jgi:predicted phage tail protein